MPLVIGTNTWVTVAQADAYFLYKDTAAAWAALSNSQKESYLVTAYRIINSLSSLTISTVTQKLKDAQCELAWYRYKYGSESDKREALASQGVKRFKVSQFEEELTKGGIPDYIMEYLEGYITQGTGRFFKVNRELQ